MAVIGDDALNRFPDNGDEPPVIKREYLPVEGKMAHYNLVFCKVFRLEASQVIHCIEAGVPVIDKKQFPGRIIFLDGSSEAGARRFGQMNEYEGIFGHLCMRENII
jgi:hypothetical protein